MADRQLKILMVGATGLVGSQVLQKALNDSRIGNIVALVRTAIPAHPKLNSIVVNFDSLPETADWWNVDGVICTLGTTIKKAGSQEAFEKVDRYYPARVAEIAKKNGVPAFAIVSAMGADPKSLFFYNRVKGNVEADLMHFNFNSLTIVRPGLIDGDRKESRTAELVAKKILSKLDSVLPKRYRANPAEIIAERLLGAVIEAKPGVNFIPSEQLSS